MQLCGYAVLRKSDRERAKERLRERVLNDELEGKGWKG